MLTTRIRRLFARTWRGALARPRPEAPLEPTPDDIRELLDRDPRRAYHAYLAYRKAGGAPYRFRPRELERLLSVRAEGADPADEVSLIA